MSGQQIGTVVGGAIGAVVGGFAGAQVGMAIGGMIGGIVDPTKTYGPHIGDGQAQSATDGSPIAWIMGTMWTAGTIVDVGQRREVKVKDKSQGKGGGPQSYHYEAHQSFAILVCESDALKGSAISSVLMVEQDGKIVYDVRPGSTMMADSNKWAANVKFYYGDEAQLPPTELEAIHGAGNSPAYRGVLMATFNDFNLTSAGDRIPTFRFLVSVVQPVFDPAPAVDVTNTPFWPAKDQSAYTGGFQDYAVPAGTAALSVPMIDPWAARRFVITAYFAGETNPMTTGAWDEGDNGATSANALMAHVTGRVVYDSGWFGAFQPNGIVLGPQNPNTFIKPTQSIIGFRFYNLGYYGGYNAYSASYHVGSVSTFTSHQGASIRLSQAVAAIASRGGLASQYVDAAQMATVTVDGYAISKQMNAVSALGPLLGAHFAYGSEYDGQIHFDLYGKDAVMTIDEDDLLEANDANGNAVTANLRNNATEFPRRIVGQYYDPAQNYMPVTVMQTRRAAGITATGDRAFDIPVVMPADKAQQTVDKALKVAYAQLEGTLEFSVPFAGTNNLYISLVAGDPVIFRGKRWIVTESILSAGYIKLTLQYDRQSAYTSDVQAIPGLDPTPPQSRYSGPTTLIAMNLPQLQTADTYGLYLAAGPVDATTQNWRGCDVQMSLDSGATWQSMTQIGVDSTMGAVVSDAGTTLNVQVNDDLVSVGSAQLDARQNAAALLHGTAAEVLQFGTATEDTVTAHLYALTGLRRAQLGTTQISGAAGDKFVMLDNVTLLPIDLAFAGKTIQLRGVGFGEDADSATVISIVYAPNTAVIISGGAPGDGLPTPGGA